MTVAFAGVQRDGPYAVKAPKGGPGSLLLAGGAGAAIDGRGARTLLQISGGAVTVSGVAFTNGFVPATHAPKGAAPVTAQAATNVFNDCVFQGNRGFDGGAVMAEHEIVVHMDRPAKRVLDRHRCVLHLTNC